MSEERDEATRSFWGFVQLLMEICALLLVGAACAFGPRLFDWLSQ